METSEMIAKAWLLGQTLSMEAVVRTFTSHAAWMCHPVDHYMFEHGYGV